LLPCLQKLQRTVDRLDLQGLSQRRYGQESTRVRRVQILIDQVDASERVVVGAATLQRAHTLVDASRPRLACHHLQGHVQATGVKIDARRVVEAFDHELGMVAVGCGVQEMKEKEVNEALAEALVVAGVDEGVDEGARDGEPVAGEEEPGEEEAVDEILVVESVEGEHLHGRPGHDEGEDHEEGHFDHLWVREIN
jgi:hypothetical protein